MANIYGYPRISTPSQSIDRQIRNILGAYPNAKLYSEVWTGTTTNRKQWQRLLRIVKPGDTIVFDSVSRMSRNAEEGWNNYEMLYSKGVNLVFLKEPHLNTEVYRKALQNQIAPTGTTVDLILDGINRFMLALAKDQIRIGFDQAEKEVADLHERTKEGLLTAKINGKILGRRTGTEIETHKAKKAKAQILKLSKDFGGGLSDADTIKVIGISRNTYYKYKKQLKQEDLPDLGDDE